MTQHDLSWNDLKLLLAICREENLAGAAKKLGVNHSTVFRRLNSIEKELNVKLFKRVSSRFTMTEAGKHIQESGEKVESEINSLAFKLVGHDLVMKGKLTITVPDAVFYTLLMPIIAKFRIKYPEIELDFIVANSELNLSRRQADIAIRATKKPNESYIGKKLCEIDFSLYASPELLKTNAIENLGWIMPNTELSQLALDKWRVKHFPNAATVFSCNTIPGMLSAAENKIGIAILPMCLCDENPKLKHIPYPSSILSLDLWVLTHQNLRYTTKVQAFMNFLSEYFRENLALYQRVSTRQFQEPPSKTLEPLT